MIELKPCPCGKVPDDVVLSADQDRTKWAYVLGDCCGEWRIEYRNDYMVLGTEESKAAARTAWNEASRSEEIGTLRADLAAANDRTEVEAALKADAHRQLNEAMASLMAAEADKRLADEALQQVQRALYRWLPYCNDGEYDDLIKADAEYLFGIEGDLPERCIGSEILASVAELEARIERLRDDIHYAWNTERECRERLVAIETVCRRLVARRNSEDGYTVLTVDLQSLEELLASPVPPAEAKVADDVSGQQWADVVRELMAVATYRPACQKYVLDHCRCYECVNERAVALLTRNAMLAAKAKGDGT